MKKNLLWTVLLLFSIFLTYGVTQLLLPLPLHNEPMEFEVKRGATFRQVVDSLDERKLIGDKSVFYILGRAWGIDRKIKAGYYPLSGTRSPWDIFNVLREGAIIEYVITIVPGDSLFEIGKKFSALDMTDVAEFMSVCTDRGFLTALDVDSPSLEGYLYPDTYRFSKGHTVKELLTMMVYRMREKYDDEMKAQTLSLGLSERELLTIASIIEKEAATDEERPLIAAVYYNRLRKGMHLQSDPTAIYGVKRSGEKITKEDLARKTPYNTYVISGLPSGPIASPGLKSITAALHPPMVPYLYFVSNNDGTHSFSVSLEQHNNAVRVYREKKRTAGSKGNS
jgi:peptidoglycan lytic transglycosylase G